MNKYIRTLLKTQIVSILFSLLTITGLTLIITVDLEFIYSLFLIMGIGVLSLLFSKKYQRIRWLDILFISLPYFIYFLLILTLFGFIFPTNNKNDYGIGLLLLFGLVGSWVSITIGLIAGK